MGELNRPASAAFILLCLTIVGAALAIGTQHGEALAVVGIASGLSAALCWAFSGAIRVRAPATAMVIVACGLLVFTAFQLIPFSAVVVERLSPHAAQISERALDPLGEPSRQRIPLTLDSNATLIAFARGLTYLLVFLSSVRLAARRRTATWLSIAVVFSALCVALVSIAHPAFGAQKVFGLYTPHFGVAERHLSPFLNPNHLAEYITIGVCVALGMALSDERAIPRVVSMSTVIVLAGIQFWVASRGGVAAMIVGVALVLWLSRRQPGILDTRFALPIVVCVLAAVVVAMADTDVRDELISADTSKLDLFQQALRMSHDFRLFGCGRGAFESVFAGYRTGHGYYVFTHPENIVAQWIDEWGWIVGGGALCVLAIALRPHVLAARVVVARGPWAAIVATVIHNLVDFGSEVPGITIALTVCVGIVVGGTVASTVPETRSWSMRPRLVGLFSFAGGIAVAVISLATISGELHNDRRAAGELARNQTISDALFRERVRPMLLRHPAEAYFAYVGAVHETVTHEPNIMPWAERTLILSPVHGPLHYLLAHWLMTRSASQARLEFRVAAEQAPRLRRAAMLDGANLVGGFDDALELTSTSDATSIELVAGSIGNRLPATQARLNALLMKLEPQSTRPLTRLAQSRVSDIETSDGTAPWCDADRPACLADATETTEALVALAQQDTTARVLYARMRIVAGQRSEALDELLSACDVVDTRTTCFEDVVSLSLLLRDGVRATNAMARIQRGGCATERECRANDEFLGDTELSRNNVASSLAHYKHALERNPEDDALLAKCGALAARAGLHAEAKEHYERLAAHHPDDSTWTAAVAREQRLLLLDTTHQL